MEERGRGQEKRYDGKVSRILPEIPTNRDSRAQKETYKGPFERKALLTGASRRLK